MGGERRSANTIGAGGTGWLRMRVVVGAASDDWVVAGGIWHID
jgi:hypothetical protein